MHRNTYLKSPDVLTANYALSANPLIRFAGQMTGVEGYMESAASGLVAGLCMARRLRGQSEPDFGGKTMLGALARHTVTPTNNYQPMNANFGILDPLEKRVKGKKFRYEALAQRALDELEQLIQAEHLED